MKPRYLLLMLVFLVGCDQEIKREVTSSYKTQRNVECEDGPAGFCYGCGMTFNGKFDCSWSLRMECPGHQQIEVLHEDLSVTYRRRDGTVYHQPESRETTLGVLTRCE